MNEYLPQPIAVFASYKRTIQNCSALTVEEYCRDILLFFRFIKTRRAKLPISEVEKADISDLDYAFCSSVSPTEVYDYLLYLADTRDNNSRTRARRLSSVKSFYKYHTAKSHMLTENPAKDIDSPHVRPAQPKFMTLDESLRLLGSLDRSSVNYERDYCILTLFLNCGMRLAELVGIDLTDIDGNLNLLRVTGKGNKMRTLYLNDACKDTIRAYLAVRAKCGRRTGVHIEDENALFLSERGKRINRNTIQKMIKKQLALAGLDAKALSTHKLRHTAATLMYGEGNVDIRVLKDILGHEQLNTTQIYTHVSDSRMKEAVEANPLANIKNKAEKK